MKLLLPLVIALAGLGVGVGAGVALKPEPEADPHAEAAPCAEGEHCEPAHAEATAKPSKSAGGDGHGGGGHGEEGGLAVVALDKPFVVPVFGGDKVVAMVVASIAVEVGGESETQVEAATPRLRDGFLAALFRHANSGGFDGAFTTGQKMEDLRAALLVAAREVFGGVPVNDVLITEIAKQDV
jgi:hypothetical protein